MSSTTLYPFLGKVYKLPSINLRMIGMSGAKHLRQKNKRTYLENDSKSRTLARRIDRFKRSQAKGKGHDCQVRALKKLREKYPDVF